MRSRRRAVVLAPLFACALFATGCLIDREQPDLTGQDIRLTIIHTADIHSRLFPYNFVPNKFDQDYGLLPADGPYGGIAKIATTVNRIRESAARSVWFDSGDCFEGAAVFNEFHGEPELRALTAAGLEGAVIGNHEFDLGAPNLFEKLDDYAGFPELAANYAWDDPVDPTTRSLRDLVKPYEIYDVDGIKIGLIGLGNEDTLTSSYMGGNSLGFRPIDTGTALAQWVRFLRPQVDLIVVASHLGLDNDEDLTPDQVDDPNASLPLQGVDLILGGHLHIVTNPPKILPHDDVDATTGLPIQYCIDHPCQTLLIHSGAFAKYVGRIDLVVHVGTDNNDPANRSRIVSFAYDNIPIDNAIPDDPKIASLMWPYSVKVNQDIDLAGVFSYVDPSIATNKITRNDPSGGDSQLGNLVARSMQTREGVEAVFALTNSLGIRADFERGPLTNEQMFNVFPFENTIVVMYLSGTEIQNVLDFVSQRSSTRGCQTQAQVAGIAFDMVCQGACQFYDNGQPRYDQVTGLPATACAKNISIGENCRNGNPSGPIDPTVTTCVPLQVFGLYRAAVNNYIAAGGSGFLTLAANTSQQDSGVSLRDALTVYLNGLTKCDPSIIDETDPASPQRPVTTRWGNVSCLGALSTTDTNDQGPEAHDGRIRPVFE